MNVVFDCSQLTEVQGHQEFYLYTHTFNIISALLSIIYSHMCTDKNIEIFFAITMKY